MVVLDAIPEGPAGTVTFLFGTPDSDAIVQLVQFSYEKQLVLTQSSQGSWVDAFYTDDGGTLCLTDYQGNLTVMNAADFGKPPLSDEQALLVLHGRITGKKGFSPDGAYYAAVSKGMDPFIQLNYSRLYYHNNIRLWQVQLPPDEVRVYDLATGETVYEAQMAGIYDAFFDSAGILTIAGNPYIDRIDPHSGEVVRRARMTEYWNTAARTKGRNAVGANGVDGTSCLLIIYTWGSGLGAYMLDCSDFHIIAVNTTITGDIVKAVDTKGWNTVIYAYRMSNKGRLAFLLDTTPDENNMPRTVPD